MKPVLFARIGFLSSIVLSFVLDGTSILGFFIALLPQLLVLFAFYLFGKNYQKNIIFVHYLIAFISSLVMNVTLIMAVKIGSQYLMSKFGNSNETDTSAFLEDLAKKAQADPEFAQEIIKAILTNQIIVFFAIIIILYIISVVFVAFSCKVLGKVTNVKSLNLAANFLLIGAATSIIGIGFISILIGMILMIVSMFQLDERLVAEGKNHENPMM